MKIIDILKKLLKKEKSTTTTKKELIKEQKVIEKLYYEEGNILTDEILEKQVALNIKRNKLNIPDESELNDEGYVQ